MQGLSYVITYRDDILVHSRDEDIHKLHLHEVFKCLANAGLTLQGEKCRIGMSEVSYMYLGHVFSASRMGPDPEKIKAIQDWPSPKDVTTLHQFLGLASYYRRYIQNFADIHVSAPLNKFITKATPFEWNTECIEAFTVLKDNLLQS